jgi:prepilin-type N-terminal cleavage/methylation domain-containing protein
MRAADQRGFSLVELLVSLTVLSLAFSALAGLLIQNARINKAQQMTADAQMNARSCLALVVSRLRSAGWDPGEAGIATVALDPDLSDDVSQIEVFADLSEPPDGDVDDIDESVTIRHVGNRVLWRPTSDINAPFVVVASNITNDADGDGTIEPMFVPDADPPTTITVQVTARSPSPDPTSGQFIRYTVSSDVVLRKSL